MALLPNLVAYWAMEETSGSRLDATGRGHDFTVTGGVVSATGKVGTCMETGDGATRYLTCANHADLTPGNTDFTWACWLYFFSTNTNTDLLGKWAPSGQLEYNLALNASQYFTFYVSSTGSDYYPVTATSLGIPSLNTWYLMVAWHDSVGDTINLQMNNGTVFSVAHTLGVYQSTTALLLGHSLFGYGLFGRADEVGLWRRVLSSTDRSALWNGGAGVTYPFGESVVTTTSRMCALIV